MAELGFEFRAQTFDLVFRENRSARSLVRQNRVDDLRRFDRRRSGGANDSCCARSSGVSISCRSVSDQRFDLTSHSGASISRAGGEPSTGARSLSTGYGPWRGRYKAPTRQISPDARASTPSAEFCR